ncbi:MAG: virulence factor SrfB [Bacteroidales bacterium]|nr:virulence factor SrfB [Bacteroidales bacterium]
MEKATLNFNDIFSDNKPTERVMEHFSKHFGFSITDLQWHYNKETISKIVESTFDTLVGKISTVLSYYGCDIVVSQLPLRFWTRQLDSIKYPTRPFYLLDFNEDKIKEKIKEKLSLNSADKKQINDATVSEIEKLRILGPFKVRIVRENYNDDKESLKIESVEDRNQNELPASYFSLQVQSMNECENYWLDSGEFSNISINQI